MPRNNTAATELAIGFGILGLSPSKATYQQVRDQFEGTVSQDSFETFLLEYSKAKPKYEKFYSLGCDLKRSYPPFSSRAIDHVRWEGPNREARTSSVARDLFAASTSISVKDNSDVIRNPSPHNLFIALPKGEGNETNSQNWYSQVALQEYQSAYECARELWWPQLPRSVVDYDNREFTGDLTWDRKALGKRIGRSVDVRFRRKYEELCHAVARESAVQFNSHLNHSLSTGKRTSVIESILRFFFRIDVQEYLFCGIEKSTAFGVLIPGLNDWKRQWKFLSLNAVEDLTRGQPVVDFILRMENQTSKSKIEHTFHAEVRWSHGKFCGNPEAKLYKGRKRQEWRWTDTEIYTAVTVGGTTKRRVVNQKPTLLDFIDKGGFGEVWKARDRRDGSLVALKQLSHPMPSADSAERFKREIGIQAGLNHIHILQVLEMDLTSDDPWFTMPLAESSLDDELPNLAGNSEKALDWFTQIVGGVAFAHAAGVVHRDLNPKNLLLFGDGTIKIADFGLGKIAGAGLNTTYLTQSGESLGTFAYAAPEQLLDAKTADQRSDIYALGRIFGQMMLGSQDPNIDTSMIPPPWKAVVVKCLSHSPEARFQSAEELLKELKRL